MKKLAFLLLSLLAGMVLLVGPGGCSAPERTGTPLLDEQAHDIYRSLMCPICPGQTIAESKSEVSAQMRAIVKEKLEQGQTKEQILQFFVERYGEAVLAEPPKSGFNLVAWLAPITAIVIGGIILWFTIKRWQRRRKEPSSEPAAPTPDTIGDEKYHKQLEKDLKDFGDKGFR